MRQLLTLCALVLFGIGSASVTCGQSNEPINNNNNTTTATCPDYLLFEYNNNYVYQLKDCATGNMLNTTKRFMSKVQTGCKTGGGCNCNNAPIGLTMPEYADPEARLFVPWGGGSGTHGGTTALQIISAGGKKFAVVRMNMVGKALPNGNTSIVVQFGLEVPPTTTSTATATLAGNTMTFAGESIPVTLKGTPPPTSQQSPQQ